MRRACRWAAVLCVLSAGTLQADAITVPKGETKTVKGVELPQGTYELKKDSILQICAQDSYTVCIDYRGDAVLREGVENNGTREGVWKLWFTDGKLRAIGTYEDGNRIGYWREWNPMGQMTVHEYAVVSGQSKPKKIPASIRLGYFCSVALFCRSGHVAEARKRADSYIKSSRKRLTEHKKRAKELRERLNDDSRLISSEEKRKIELELRKEIALYDSLMHTTLGETGALTRFNDRVSKTILARVDTIIQSIADSNEYRYVIDERNTIVYPAEKKGSYYPDELIGQLENITLDVIDRVDRQTLDCTIEKPANRNEAEK